MNSCTQIKIPICSASVQNTRDYVFGAISQETLPMVLARALTLAAQKGLLTAPELVLVVEGRRCSDAEFVP